MGTLREDMLYSSSHSDPDYTSSSEQSCDTVIYIGANGQSLSDRELTDNEGPPRHVPRTNPRLPRRPSGSRSSGDDSDSGRSVCSVRSVKYIEYAGGGGAGGSRLPLRRAVSTVAGGPQAHVHSMPGSPNMGMVKMGHRMGVHTGGAGACPEASSSVPQWSSDGKTGKVHVHSSQRELARSIHDKQKPLEGEQWIDGPGASIYPEKKASEMWVDGPQAFVVKPSPSSSCNLEQSSQPQSHAPAQGNFGNSSYMPQASAPAPQPTAAISSPSLSSSRIDGSHHHHRGESSSLSSHHHHHHHHHRSDSARRGTSRKVGAEEQWVDGPSEMVSVGGPSNHQPMHTSSKMDVKPSTTSALASNSSSAERPTAPTTTSTQSGGGGGVNEKALRTALAKHVMNESSKDTKRDRDSSTSADSNFSTAVEAAESRPQSFLDSSDDQAQITPLKGDKELSQAPADTHVSRTHVSTSASPSRKPRKSSEGHSSSRHSPSPSPGQTRRGQNHTSHSKMDAAHASRLQKSQLPGSASPTHRVRQWIKSVSSDQSESSSPQEGDGKDNPSNSSIAQSPPKLNPAVTTVATADAETNTEHDSDFERLADEGGVCTWDEDDEVNAVDNNSGYSNNANSFNNNSNNTVLDKTDESKSNSSSKNKCNNSNDFGHNKALDVSLDSSCCETVDTLRDSIYEAEVEERLELMKARDGMDNETFSSMSCSARDAEEGDACGLDTDSLLVQHTKVLTESRQSAQLARHIAGDRQHKMPADGSVTAFCDLDAEASDFINKPLLSRKPDGASNPNLVSSCEERIMGKSNLSSSTVAEANIESVYILAGQIEPDMDQFESDSFCDRNSKGLHNIISGNGFDLDSSSCIPPSPVLDAKGNKPPLPSKSSPLFNKHNKFTKSASAAAAPLSSSASTSQQQPAALYHSSKLSSKESSPDPLQQRVLQSSSLSSSAKATSSSSSPSARGRGFSRTSSSGVSSQSPASSVTSSPLVSATSATSKSSPSPTASPSQRKKHQGGGLASKLPFCSSRSFSPSSAKDKARKKDKDGSKNKDKEGCGNASGCGTGSLRMPRRAKGNDSDSGNDSGIVTNEKRLLSPYATITKPRTPSHSSSGHGSDNR